MSKQAMLVTAALIATVICGLSALVLPQQPPLPPDLAWSTERLTGDQAEALSDRLAALVYELKRDLDTHQGKGSAQIIQTWQGSSGDQPSALHIARLLNFVLERGPINLDHLTHLLGLAHHIRFLADDGAITVGSQVDGADLIIHIQSLETGETRRVVLRP